MNKLDVNLESRCSADVSGIRINQTNHQRHQKTIFVVLVVGVLTLVLSECFARFIIFVGKPASSENPQYHVKYLVASKLTASQDNIILCGDSLMKAGLYPELVTAKLRKLNHNIRVVNLAANGGNQNDAIIYLDYLIRQQVKPKLVVYDYEISNTGSERFSAQPVLNPTDCKSTTASSKNAVASISTRGYVFEGLLTRPVDFWKSIDVMLSDNLYIVRHRGNLKRFILDFLQAIQFPKRFERKAFVEPRDWSDAATTTEGMSPNHKLIYEEDPLEQKKAIWPFHATSPQSPTYSYNPDAFDPIIDYCQKHQIELVLVWLPHQSSIYERYYCQAPYTESWFKQQFLSYAKQPHVHPLYLNLQDEDPNYYTDYRHLSTYGCIEASKLFAKALATPPYSSLIQPNRIIGH